MIENTLADEEILQRLTARGYDAEALAEGQRLHRAAIVAVDAQDVAASAIRMATERARVAEQHARDAYQELVQTVRAVFPANSAQRKALDVTGPMPHEVATFVAVATTLFNNVQNIPQISAVLKRYGYDAATLQNQQDTIVAYRQALQAQVRARAAAKQATQAQTEAVEALQQWTAQYRKIAKIALRKQPELLKTLGLAAASKRPTTKGSAKPQAEAAY
jgi:hypothetical protein